MGWAPRSHTSQRPPRGASGLVPARTHGPVRDQIYLVPCLSSLRKSKQRSFGSAPANVALWNRYSCNRAQAESLDQSAAKGFHPAVGNDNDVVGKDGNVVLLAFHYG